MIGNPLSRYYTRDGSTRAMSRVPKTTIDRSIKEIIDEEIHALVRKYQNGSGCFVADYLQLVLDDAYDTAPYDFQRSFNRGLLRYADQFRTPKRKKIPVSLSLKDSEVSSIQDYLKILGYDFNDDFSDIFDLFLEWEDTMQLALKYNHSLALMLLHEYWEFFVRLLRIKQHENIPQSEVDRWIKTFNEKDIISFEKQLKRTRNELLLQDLDSTPDSEDINNAVNEIMDCAYDLSIKSRSAQ
jgi:hypothetical protein